MPNLTPLRAETKFRIEMEQSTYAEGIPAKDIAIYIHVLGSTATTHASETHESTVRIICSKYCSESFTWITGECIERGSRTTTCTPYSTFKTFFTVVIVDLLLLRITQNL